MPAQSVTFLQPSGGQLLTVGAGMEFATLADACRAAVNGDTIAVKAGTYVNDFCTISANVNIVALGGMVNEVATLSPPNDKGIFTVNANLSIQGFSFTGGSDGSPDGNVSGIRLQAGNLTVNDCYFHNMQEGLLADPDPTANVVISNSEFADCGTGDGYSHNLYVGSVASLTITGCYFHGAVVGHEIKSRAAVTTIENNVIVDGPGGTGSYDIDIPNAGVATIENNVIEKGPDASNAYAIHYGGETQYAYAQNSLTVTGNTILNDLPADQGVAVLNQSAVNGLTTSATVDGNALYNFLPGNIVLGAGTQSGNTTLVSEPAYSTLSPWLSEPDLAIAPGPQVLTLVNGNHTITGGAARLSIDDEGASNSITGGAGGLAVVAIGGWDMIRTAAKSSNTLKLVGRNTTLTSAGNDQILATGQYEAITATGHASITGTNFSTYSLDGAGETLTTSSPCILDIGHEGVARLVETGGNVEFSLTAGGTLTALARGAIGPGTPMATATVEHGAATGWVCSDGTITVSTGAHGAAVYCGTGAVSATGGAGNDSLFGGSGTDDFALGAGEDKITLGSGAITVTGGARDIFELPLAATGSLTIMNWNSQDQFAGAGASFTSIITQDGATLLTDAAGGHITLVGVTNFA